MSIFRQTFSALVCLHLKLAEYRALRRSRKALLYLSDAMLRDIGITREQAVQQGSLPFWKKNQSAHKVCKDKLNAKRNHILDVSK